MSRNLIIVKREQLETELYQLEYLIKHFNMKLFPNGDGMSQFLTWLHMRKSVREKLAGRRAAARRGRPIYRDLESSGIHDDENS